VLTHDSAASGATRRSHVRRFTTTVSVAAYLVLLGALLDASSADRPQGWSKAPHVSGLDFLVVLVLIPLGLAAVISLLVSLPSLVRDRGYQPGQSWRGESEWFGGPGAGVTAAADVSPEQLEASSRDTGGTSGTW
jgi:hypothetical protein